MKRTLLTLAALFGFTFLMVAPVALPVAAAPPQQAACESIDGTYDAATGECSTGGGTDLQGLIRTLLTLFSIIVGITAVIMIIVGGFKYITSGGDSNKITSAKNTIVYAIVGLVIAGLAQFLVQFVIQHTVK